MKLITPSQPRVEVAYQERVGAQIKCSLCPLACTFGEGDIGVCGGRQLIDGKLIATNYAQVCSLNLDPIEKKPLYHFLPGSEILSVGPNGCNLNCEWCANWQITQNTAPTRVILPGELADMVDAVDGIGVAYTYAEPLIWFEYVCDVGRVLHERGLVNVFITNGFINREPLREILEIADAFNVDLKSRDDYCYRHYCGGKLADVERTIKTIHDSGKHLEITHLVVTGVNDDLRKIEKVVDWIADIDPNIPLHLTRYYPSNRYEAAPTPVQLLKQALKLARSKLNWVYLGRCGEVSDQDSFCPNCHELLIRRDGFTIEVSGMDGNKCASCGREVNFKLDL